MKIWKRETEWREKTIKQLLDYLYQTYHIIISLIVVDDEEDEEEEKEWDDEEEEECDEEGCRGNAELISEREDGIAWPCAVAGLVKKRVFGCARTPLL